MAKSIDPSEVWSEAKWLSFANAEDFTVNEFLNAVLIMIPIDEPISCFLPVIAISCVYPQNFAFFSWIIESHEPIKQLKRAKEGRTKIDWQRSLRNKTKVKSHWNLTTEISFNPWASSRIASRMRRVSSIFTTAGFCTEACEISIISSLLIPTSLKNPALHKVQFRLDPAAYLSPLPQ